MKLLTLAALLSLTACEKYKCVQYETRRVYRATCTEPFPNGRAGGKGMCALYENVVTEEQECVKYGWVKE